MGPLGWQETLVIFVLVLLLFGPKKLPEVGKNIAKAINEFRRHSNDLKDTWQREMANLERETQDIKKEAESLTAVTSDYTSDTSTYNYDSSYDYGAYGYPDSNDPSTTSTTDSSTVSDPATQGADSTGMAATSVMRSRYPRTDVAAASRQSLFFSRLFRPAITKLAARRLTSHSHGAGSVSSKSLMSKIKRRSGVANPPKLSRWQSPQACTRTPVTGVCARSPAMMAAAPR